LRGSGKKKGVASRGEKSHGEGGRVAKKQRDPTFPYMKKKGGAQLSVVDREGGPFLIRPRKRETVVFQRGNQKSESVGENLR